MQNPEKRISPRQSLQIPLRFRSAEFGGPDPELASETTNISRSGLFMKSPLPLKVGWTLAITLRVPTYLSGSARSMVQCSGRVVHERELPNGDIGYGIQFENLLSFQRNAMPLPAVSLPVSVGSRA
ncbi:MAG TPA: PilZ domain-containing protein [Candidatus Limnocylindrales bacterium]|nr:PilZ domain-containing protein [Candidatus Limnocylindrales bacterium]